MKIDYQIMMTQADPEPLLEYWSGSRLVLWAYSASHRALEVRLMRDGEEKHLAIICGDVEHLNCPTKSEGVILELISTQELFVLQDKLNGIEIKAGLVGVKEVKTD